MLNGSHIIADQEFYSSILAKVSSGFYDPELGKATGGAGLILVTESFDFGLFRRSDQVSSKHYWGNTGGVRRRNSQGGLEFSLVTAIRESIEEAENLPDGVILPLPTMYHRKFDKDFFYLTYTLVVPDSVRDVYSPKLNWEHDDFRWFSKDELKNIKVHYGTQYALDRINSTSFLSAVQLLQDSPLLRVS